MFSGNKIILDDISTLPEMSVVLIPSRTSISVKQNVKETSGELLQFTKDPLVALVLEEQIALTSDISEEEKEEVKKAFSLAKLEAAMNKNMNIKNAQMQIQQIEQKIQAILQAKAGMGQAPQQPGEGEEQPEQQMSIGGPPNPEERAVEGTPQEQPKEESLISNG
jgi:sorbitol-specific phosphotransferase system component IIBC